MNNFADILSNQRQFYYSQVTKDINFRRKSLKDLYSALSRYESRIYEAVQLDFKKSKFEIYGSELGFVLSEIRLHLRNLKYWAKPKMARGSLLDFKSSAKIYPEPLGQVLIISPWNYPLMLMISPLIGSISAGNTAILKPSESSPATASVIRSLISETFPEEYICCIEGDRDVSEQLTKLKFDLIFFTGSAKTARLVMESAAKNLTRVCLELGGKNPCIIDKTASPEIASRRIAWGKFLNGGQSCVAPDYILADKSLSEKIKAGLKKSIIDFYGSDPKNSKDFPRIINIQQYQRLKDLIVPEKVYYGGIFDDEELYISPTILENVSFDDEVMKEEIFGPVLPVIEYNDLNEIPLILKRFPKPLSFYIFSRDRNNIKKLTKEIEAGNCNINDTMMQYINKSLPFGGKGDSGIGMYHGKYSFECFSHFKSVNRKSLLIDLPFRYPPYTSLKYRIIRMFLK
jgi:aldehyde dehydrogenase (NAD+)